jgi:uncharacterized protein DUF4288
MPWFTVNVLLKGTHVTRPSVEPLWEESFLLIDAGTEEAAAEKAARIGRAAEHDYSVDDGEAGEPPGTLKWTFEQIERVYMVEDKLRDGTELFSRFLRDAEVKSLLKPFPDK